MRTDTETAEARYIRLIELEYIEQGYSVDRDIHLDFIPDFRVDMIARKGDETKILEIKTAASLASNPVYIDIRKAIESRPGWKYGIVLVPEPEKLNTHKAARPLAFEDVMRRVGEAERVLDSGFPESAAVIAWSACEGLLRILLEEENIFVNNITSSGYLIGKAVSEGAIGQADYRYLTDSEKYINAIIHGYNTDYFDSEKLARELIETVLGMTQEFVST